jgi:ankyrin repeat protein
MDLPRVTRTKACVWYPLIDRPWVKFLAVLAPLLLPALAQSASPASDGEIANRALLMAAQIGRTDLVAFALDHGAHIEARDRRPTRRSALVLAVQEGHYPVVRLLLARGADANAVTGDGYTPLMVAADARDDPLMGVELIGAGARVNWAAADGTTALMAAAGRGHEYFLNLLLLNNAALHATDDQGRDALLLAAEDGSLACTDALLKAGADPNRRARNGETSLGRAVIGAYTRVTARLLAAGADVNAPGARGQTPLIIAVRTGSTTTAMVLLQAGADVNRVELGNGNSALMYAANSGFTDLIGILLAGGADVGATARDGWTAVQAAEMVGETAIVDRLRAAARGD